MLHVIGVGVEEASSETPTKHGSMNSRLNLLMLNLFVWLAITARAALPTTSSPTSGDLDEGFQNGLSGANFDVCSIALQSDGKILIGGLFTVINGTNRNYLARLNSDGNLDTSFMD